MRLVLMGTGPFAVPSFEALRAQGETILGVVTRPPVLNPKSKEAPKPSPVSEWAISHNLSLHMPASINSEESIVWLKSLNADLLVVCDYGQILSKDALATTRSGGINLHGSLLPRHRGAAPVQWSILAGDDTTGISVIHMTPALDGGPVLCNASTPIADEENAFQLEARLSQLGVAEVLKSVAMLKSGSELSLPLQDNSKSTRAPRLTKQDGQLHFGYPLCWIDRQIRGLQPWPGVYGILKFPDGKELRVIVPRARPVPIPEALRTDPANWTIGQLLYGEKLKRFSREIAESQMKGIAVIAKDGLLLIETIQPAGKKSMSAEEFLRGYNRYASIRFDLPVEKHKLLERMMALNNSSHSNLSHGNPSHGNPSHPPRNT